MCKDVLAVGDVRYHGRGGRKGKRQTSQASCSESDVEGKVEMHEIHWGRIDMYKLQIES